MREYRISAQWSDDEIRAEIRRIAEIDITALRRLGFTETGDPQRNARARRVAMEAIIEALHERGFTDEASHMSASLELDTSGDFTIVTEPGVETRTAVGMVRIESGSAAIVDPEILAESLGLAASVVRSAIEALAASGDAYIAPTHMGDGVFPVSVVETPLENVDPAELSRWEGEYGVGNLASLSWSVVWGATAFSGDS